MLSLSACNMGLGLAHLRLTSQMRCLHFCQSVNVPLRIPPYPATVFYYWWNLEAEGNINRKSKKTLFRKTAFWLLIDVDNATCTKSRVENLGVNFYTIP